MAPLGQERLSYTEISRLMPKSLYNLLMKDYHNNLLMKGYPKKQTTMEHTFPLLGNLFKANARKG